MRCGGGSCEFGESCDIQSSKVLQWTPVFDNALGHQELDDSSWQRGWKMVDGRSVRERREGVVEIPVNRRVMLAAGGGRRRTVVMVMVLVLAGQHQHNLVLAPNSCPTWTNLANLFAENQILSKFCRKGFCRQDEKNCFKRVIRYFCSRSLFSEGWIFAATHWLYQRYWLYRSVWAKNQIGELLFLHVNSFWGGCVLYYSYVGAAFWHLIVTLDLYYYSSQIVNIVSAIIQLLFMVSLLNTIPMQSK